MFEADLWDVDSLSRPNIFLFGHRVDIAVQQAGLPAPVPSGSAIFANEKHSKVFFFKRPALYALIMMGGETSIGKALQLIGLLCCLDSRTYQTQVVHLGKIGLLFPSRHSGLRVSHRQTDTLTGALRID